MIAIGDWRQPAWRLRAVLVLAALHSAGVGLGLILHPSSVLVWLGYAPVNEPFFPTQGGVFHLVMAMGYGMAAHDLVRHRCLVVFAVAVKTIAFVFLLVYWLFVSSLPIVLLSGIGDGLLAAALAWLYAAWRGQRAPMPAAGGP